MIKLQNWFRQIDTDGTADCNCGNCGCLGCEDCGAPELVGGMRNHNPFPSSTVAASCEPGARFAAPDT